MTDRLDGRIRAFVVELLDDPPAPPPFPHPDAVVVNGDRPERRSVMSTTGTRESETRPISERRGLLVAAAAFAVVVIAGLAAIVLQASTDEVASPTDPMEVALAFDEAQNAGSVEGMMALVADDAVFDFGIVTMTGKEEIRAWAQRQVDQGVTVLSTNHKVEGNQVTANVVLIFTDGRRDPNRTTITVEDGLITLFVAR